MAIAFTHMDTANFNVFTETQLGDLGSQHFITGNGGYLQAFVFGYSGMRIERVGVLSFASQRPVLPPYNTSAATLRGVHLLGTVFDFRWDAATLCVTLQAGGGGGGGKPLELRVRASGQRMPISATPTCVPVDAVDVAGVGYA